MKSYIQFPKLILSALLLFFFAGCDLFGSEDPQPGTVTVSLSNNIGGQDLALNQQSYSSSVGHSYSVTLVEYIITDIALRDEDGNLVSLASAHYVNQEDASTHALRAVEVPAGKYNAIQFTFGIEGSANVFGNLERSTDFDNMMWPMMMPMGDGTTERYHYMRFEGRYGTDGAFRIHTGPTGGNDNSLQKELAIDIDVDGQAWMLDLAVNLDEWLTGPNEWDFDDYSAIMGNQAAQTLLYDNGESVFGIKAITTE